MKKNKYDVFSQIIEKAKDQNVTIALPEGHDPRVIEAAEWASVNKLCKVVVLGDKIILAEKFSKKALKNITIVDPKSVAKTREMYAQTLYELRKHKGMTYADAMEVLKDNLTYAMMMLKSDDVDGVVAGAVRESADVLKSAFQIIGTRPDVQKVSSVFLMEMRPESSLGQNGLMVFGDCAVNINPTDEELAEIAILSAETAHTICGIDPTVALLSYTTKADENINNEQIQKIKRAYKIVRRKNSLLRIDGDVQADAALDKSVCDSKCFGSILQGKANVMIFPDLFSGNIAYKLVQRIAGVRAVGPIMQGLKKPVNDLSRGTTAEEIILNMAITILQSKNTIKGV